MTPYQYVLLRYRPNISTGEFANIGVLLWVADTCELKHVVTIRYSRQKHFFADFDGNDYKVMVNRVKSRCNYVNQLVRRKASGDLISGAPSVLSEALALIQPEDANCFAFSDVRGGIAKDLDDRLCRLYDEFIGRYEDSHDRTRFDETKILDKIAEYLASFQPSLEVQQEYTIETPDDSHEFAIMWQNGKMQVLDAISFDLIDERRMITKAHEWAGLLFSLSRTNSNFQMISVVAPPTSPELRKTYDKAVSILKNANAMRAVITYRELDKLIEMMSKDMGITPVKIVVEKRQTPY